MIHSVYSWDFSDCFLDFIQFFNIQICNYNAFGMLIVISLEFFGVIPGFFVFKSELGWEKRLVVCRDVTLNNINQFLLVLALYFQGKGLCLDCSFLDCLGTRCWDSFHLYKVQFVRECLRTGRRSSIPIND